MTNTASLSFRRGALVIALLAYLAVGVVVTLGRGGFAFIYREVP